MFRSCSSLHRMMGHTVRPPGIYVENMASYLSFALGLMWEDFPSYDKDSVISSYLGLWNVPSGYSDFIG